MSSAATALPSQFGGARELVHRFKAPLLEKILAPPDEDEAAPRAVVLDLGGPGQALIERLSDGRRTRIEIADLVAQGGLARLNLPEALEQDGPALVRELLPAPNDEPLDLVLLWDLPNYLGLPALSLLVDVLSGRAGPGCKLHMLIAYSKREMSATASRYVPEQDGCLQQILESEEICEAPRYSPEALGKAVEGFDYQKGVLLANGMQEFVYAWPDQPGADRPF